MRKTLTLIHRTLLALGVLVALTPCNFCHKADMVTAVMSHCSMKHKTGHDCCHSKKTSPLCQIMDQSSVSTVSAQVPAPAVQAVPLQLAAVSIVRTAPCFIVVSSGSPPLRGPLSLRI